MITHINLHMISIHASAKEATRFHILQCTHIIFQSTPPRRRRRSNTEKRHCFILRFQSTPPRRRRLISSNAGGGIFNISIHASAKEATSKCGQSPCDDRNFNPRLREGGDYIILMELGSIVISIHASAKEATGKISLSQDR